MKTKILSLASLIALSIVLTLVGIWAVADLDFAVGGDITYTAPAPEPVTPEEVPYLTFEYYDDLTAKLMSVSSSAPQKVEIPSQITKNGKTYNVTKIAEGEWDELDGEGEGICYAGGCDLIIPDSIIEIGAHAFAECSFNSVSIGKSVEKDTNNPFRFASIENLIIRKGVSRIGNGFFFETSFPTLELPNGLVEIGMDAFYYNSLLKNITIPDSVEIIGRWAFNASALTKVTIGTGIKSIGMQAFLHTYLTEVYVKATIPPAFESSGRDMFTINANNAGFQIYVPRMSENAYKSADGWSEYAEYIVGYDF